MFADPILVTGAAGFIGSHVCQALLRRGTPVVGLDNFDPYYDVALRRDNVCCIERTAEQAASSFTMMEGDIGDAALVARLLQTSSISGLIHLAAKVGVRPSVQDPLGYARTNVEGTVTLLQAASEAEVQRFIFASSSSVYGSPTAVPFCENGPANKPISPYGATKAAGEVFCHAYHALHELSAICLRLFTVYGPRQRPDLAINKFARLLLTGGAIPRYGDGTSIRDYTYVGDITRGILAALDSDITWDIINLGGGSPVSLNELITTLEEVLGVAATIEQLPLQPGDVPRTYADINRAQRLLNWQPRVSFREGLEKFVEWSQSTP